MIGQRTLDYEVNDVFGPCHRREFDFVVFVAMTNCINCVPSLLLATVVVYIAFIDCIRGHTTNFCPFVVNVHVLMAQSVFWHQQMVVNVTVRLGFADYAWTSSGHKRTLIHRFKLFL